MKVERVGTTYSHMNVLTALTCDEYEYFLLASFGTSTATSLASSLSLGGLRLRDRGWNYEEPSTLAFILLDHYKFTYF